MRRALFLAIVLAAPCAFAADAASPYGVNAHLPGTAELDQAQSAGFGWVRYDFNWFSIEQSKGVYDWSAEDAAVDAAVARGLNVYATLAYTPAWATSTACTIDNPNEALRCQAEVFDNVSDWTDFVTAAVTRFGDRVKVFGMWNEPNLGGFWQGSQAQYVNRILVPGSAAVHAACGDCLVGGPETAGLTKSSRWNGSNGICIAGACIRNGWELDLGGVLDAGGSSIDVVTQHFYNASAQDEAVGQLCDGQFFGTTMTHDSLRGVLSAHGASGKPVWLTETGYETTAGNSTSEASQSSLLTGLLSAREQLAAGSYAPAANDPFTISKIFLYDLKDGAADGWGMIRADGSTKPAYAAVSQYIAAHAGTPTPTPTATATGTAVVTPTASPTGTSTPGGGGGNPADGGSKGACDVGSGAAPGGMLASLLLAALTVARRRKPRSV